MDTYAGSILAKRNKWKTSGWLTLTTSALIAGGGLYCNYQMNNSFDNYNNATETTNVMNFKNDATNYENYRDYCYYAASGAIIYSAFSWIKTAIYNRKL